MDEYFMKTALMQAEKAKKRGEVPIGAVVVKNGKIIAKDCNRREKRQMATAHAEIGAIERACKKSGSWRLSGCEIYVTLEPCLMCLGAILNARIDKLYFGSYDDKRDKLTAINCAESGQNGLNHNLQITGGVLKEQCDRVLSDFFKSRRR